MQFKQWIMKLNEVYHLIIYCLTVIAFDATKIQRNLCLATVTVPSKLLQRLSKDFSGYAHSFTPLFLILNSARIYKTVTCERYNMSAEDHVKIACKEGTSKGKNIYTKILQKLWL